MLLLNLLLMVSWVVLTGNYSPAHLLFGFFLGYFVLWILQGPGKRQPYFGHMFKIIELFFFFIWELIVSNFKVAAEVLRPGIQSTPAILAIPLDMKDRRGIVLLSNMITLTPGTLTVDISDDHQVLYMHTMYAEDIEDARVKIKQGFERRIREIYES